MENAGQSSNRVNDINRGFRDIFPSQESMRQQMVEIAKHSSHRSQAQYWVSKMRFLIKHQSKDTVIPYHQSSVIGSVTAPTAFPASSSSATSPSGTVLKLADRSILTDPTAYVAVSYCWSREDAEWFTRHIEAPIEVLTDDNGKRPSTVPPDFLHRSVAYATHRDINAIWIDQESINQNDPIDKENGIQAMDIVYQDSRYPIAVLEFFFQTQIEVDVFTSVISDMLDFDPGQIESLEDVLSSLSQDLWFSRAWTLQESTSAGASMMLLLGCPGLDKNSYFGFVPGEFEISIWDFQNAMVNSRTLIEEGLAAGTWSDTTSAVHASNCADVLYNYIPTTHPDLASTERNSSHRQQCTAAEALTFLDDRFNSVFSDRLAILANICNYEVRINSTVLELLGYSFSAYALTLAILNGDMSLLAGCQANEEKASTIPSRSNWFLDQAKDGRSSKPPFYRNDDSDSPANAYGFSWGPNPWASLSNIQYFEECGDLFRLKPATLSVYGLRVCGVLWEIKELIKTPNTHRQFASRWQEELDLQATERIYEFVEKFEESQEMHNWWVQEGQQQSEKRNQRQMALLRNFCWSLVHELIDSGHTDMARASWGYIQPRGTSSNYGWTSKTAPPPYPFETIFGSLNHSLGSDGSQGYNENDVRNRLHTSSFTTNLEHHPTILRRILGQVCENGALICGIPVNYPDYQELRVWLESCKQGDLVFTPFTQMASEILFSLYGSEAVSWRVLQTGNIADGCEVLHCLGRRRGLYRFEGLEPRVYTLD